MKKIFSIFIFLSLYSCIDETTIEYPKYIISKQIVDTECTEQFAEIISPHFGFDKKLFKPNTISIIKPRLDNNIYKDSVWKSGIFIEFDPKQDSLSTYYYYINPDFSLIYICYQINDDTELIINNTWDVLITDLTNLNKNKCLEKIYPLPAYEYKKEDYGFGRTDQMFKITGTWSFDFQENSKNTNLFENKKIVFERNGNAYLLDSVNDTIGKSIFPEELNGKLIFDNISLFVRSCTKHGMLLESENGEEYYKIIKQEKK